jgi:pyruvate dehydrogenase E2 component (dihydrolipoamide acetyltransferase)
MATTVVMPQLGNTVESCLVTAWHVKVGDTVEASTVLCDIETDKSTMDVPAGLAGTVLALLVEEGDDVPVKSPIAIIGDAGETVDPPAAPAAGEAPASGEEAAQGAPVTPSGPAAPVETPTPGAQAAAAGAQAPAPRAQAPTAGGADAPASPRAKATAAAAGISVQAAGAGTGPHGRIIERDVQAAIAAGPGLTAGARGADAYTPGQTGTGIGGRVTTADLATAAAPAASAEAAPQPAPVAPPSAQEGSVTETPLKGIRKLIADRMRESLAVSAQLSYDMSASAEGLLALRARLKGTDPSLGLSVVTIGDLIGLVTAKVVREYPSLNAHLVDGVLRSYRDVHLGMAVDTPRGLMVPTIRNAAGMGLREFAATTKDLAAQCQEGRISPDLLAGATFTVSNLGSFGITSFTPIVNQPQTGILGINAIVPAATIDKDGGLGVERRISFSLTADHQVVDGADAARFLRDLTTAIASVDLFLMA